MFNWLKSFIYQFLGTIVDHICVKLRLKCFLDFEILLKAHFFHFPQEIGLWIK